MDFLKKAVNAYEDSQQGGHQGQQNAGNNQEGGDFGVTGGSRFNQPASDSYGAGAGGLGGLMSQFLDQGGEQEAVAHADQHSGSSGDSQMFGQAMSFLKSSSGQNHVQQGDVDEQGVMDAHQQAYSQGNGGHMDAQSMGAAAALQALKKFTGTGGQSSAASQGGQSQLLGLAMSEASKLFDQSGGAASGGKQDAINSAGATIMKFMLKSQMSGMMGTGGGAAGGGGLGNLVSMASKFM